MGLTVEHFGVPSSRSRQVIPSPFHRIVYLLAMTTAADCAWSLLFFDHISKTDMYFSPPKTYTQTLSLNLAIRISHSRLSVNTHIAIYCGYLPYFVPSACIY